ncbi:MAG: ABC transporter substrate-binding protein [Litorilinea sp.]
MRQTKRTGLATLLIALLVLLAACAPAAAPQAAPGETAGETPAAGEETSDPSGEVVVRLNTTSGRGTHFNPAYLIGTGSQYHTFMWIWLPLTRADNNGQQIPFLAESFSASEDAMTWTFNIHPAANWSDGTPVTAEDVVFTYHTRLDPEMMAALQLDWAPAWHLARLGKIRGYDAFANGEADSIEGLVAVDEKTFVIELDEPSAVVPIGTQHLYVQPKHILDGLSPEEFAAHPYVTTNPDVVSGPLRLATYEPGEYIEMERNPEWWGEEQLQFDRLILYQTDTQANINRVLAGEQDMIRGVGAEDLPLFEEQPFLRVEPVLSLGWLTIGTNARDQDYMTKELFQALLHATDRDALNDLLYRGEAVNVNSIILGPEWAIPDDLNPYEYDLERAREILEEIDWDFDRTLRFLVFNDEDLLAPALQQMWGDAGVQVELNLRAFSDSQAIFAEGDYDFVSSGGGSAAADPSLSGSYIACDGSGPQRLGYCNEELDAAFAAGRTFPTPEERAEYYHTAARILNEEMPYIPLFRVPLFYVINERLQSVTPAGSVDDQTWDLFNWEVVE